MQVKFMLASPRPQELARMTVDETRDNFLVPDVFDAGKLILTFTDLDRMAIGGAQPAGMGSLVLENHKQTGADFFLQRREIGILNVGNTGSVRVDGKDYSMANLDCLYIGMGAKDVSFSGDGAKFYFISTPAHATHPTTLLKKSECKPLDLGDSKTSNKRQIFQYIHAGGIKSCQLVMGFTDLAEGSVWNTMPPHTHSRRTEIYFYFDVKPDQSVVHFLGEPTATRHLFVHNEQATLSPAWSIHAGCGTSNYKFIWAMGGENQTFDDMDKVGARDLK
jgi:4-deoxy-L-threo-5-hexosulose-uronate ketol-isomerase